MTAAERMRSVYRAAVPDAARRARRAGAEAVRAGVVGLWDPSIRLMGDRLEGLRGIHRGERCFVMGNGPSLNLMDLELLAGEQVWMSNRAHLLLDRVAWRPSHWVAIDSVVVPDNAEELQLLARDLPATRFFFPRSFRLDGTLKSRPNVWWFREIQVPLDGADSGEAFSLQVSDHVAMGATVTIAMLQLAVWMGFDPIYLIGCDTSYRVDTHVEREGQGSLRSTIDADANHFDPAYFGAGRRWNQPHVERMVQHYEIARAACDAIGVQVLNATAGGNLEAFPRVRYESLFDSSDALGSPRT